MRHLEHISIRLQRKKLSDFIKINMLVLPNSKKQIGKILGCTGSQVTRFLNNDLLMSFGKAFQYLNGLGYNIQIIISKAESAAGSTTIEEPEE